MSTLLCACVAEGADHGRRGGRSSELVPGDVLGGKYLLVHKIGAGGMGQVWQARNLSTGAEVAVKALLPALASSRDALVRFRDEAHATARLAHRGIVRIFDLLDLDVEAGTLLIVMELLRGHTLAERIAHEGPLSVAETMAVVLPILSALCHAHGAGVVHRDVKPDNVILALEPDGKLCPKLVDFGVSQLREPGDDKTSDGLVVGTPWYMSPEQARGEQVDDRCDVFGVGLLIYECLTGINPLRVVGMAGAGYARRLPPIPGISGALWAEVVKALAERREDRFSSAAEFAEALVAATEARGPWRFFSSRAPILAGSSAAVALIAAVVGWQSCSRPVANDHVGGRAVLADHAPQRVLFALDTLAEHVVDSTPNPGTTPREKHGSSLRFRLVKPGSRERCVALLRDPGF